ncbi:MAG: outer membrane lipid asymmetry maintenance protein MlaD [Lentisphaeria bacterium]|nr:outer membrane lipid asymmetry maintenance protein MlaD [Lentisphaeria bacterium]
MRKKSVELTVGVFVIAGALCFAYLSVRFTRAEISGGDTYEVTAVFENVGGLRKGANVEIAGVPVGRVVVLSLDDYRALATMRIDKSVELQTDTIASIKTKGLIGEKYVSLLPGGDDEVVAPGGRLRDTESALDIEALISKIAFGKVE